MASIVERGVVVGEMGAPFLVIWRVLLCFEEASGVLVVGLEGLSAVLVASLTQDYWRGAAGHGSGGGRLGRPGAY